MAGIRRILSSILPQQNAPVLSQSELAEQGATEEEYEVLASNEEEETPTEPIGIPISALPGADTPTGNDAIPGVQDDETVQYSLADLLAWIIGETTPADIGAVPDTRKVNNHTLDADVTVTAADVGAVPTSRTVNNKALSADITLAASDVGAQPEINVSGILKGDGNGGVSAAVAGTDYATPASIPSAYTSNPEMDGTASAGSSGAWAKGDHVHPSDTSKQDVLTFDAAPTQNSNNPVKSGGVYTALDGKAPAGYGLGETAPNVIDSTANLNTIPYGGFFRWGSASIPSNSPISNAGYLLNLPFNNTHAGVQVVADLGNDILMYRTYSGGWNAWKTITAT